jgi:antitoxin YefM
MGGVQTLSISKAKDRLNELVDEAAKTHEHITITKNGSPAAMLVSFDEWESLQETLFWLSQPGILEDLAQSRRDYEEGNTLGEAEVRARLGMPARD